MGVPLSGRAFRCKSSPCCGLYPAIPNALCADARSPRQVTPPEACLFLLKRYKSIVVITYDIVIFVVYESIRIKPFNVPSFIEYMPIGIVSYDFTFLIQYVAIPISDRGIGIYAFSL